MANHDSTPTAPTRNADTLCISNLDLSHGVSAPYIFGERKVQPATVSISLELSRGFSSAASADALDQNTMHYGNLAKAIREKRPEGQTLEALVEWVERAVDEMAERRDGSSRVGTCVVEVLLPKASMSGNGVSVTSVRDTERIGRRTKIRFDGVRIMALIGVNSVERTAKQALDVDLEVYCVGGEILQRDVPAFGLEGEMIEVIEPTKFETLESLGEHVIKHLQPQIQETLPSCSTMSLTMRKPKAIAFADAPAVSLTRVFTHGAREADGNESALRSGGRKLNLIKPYT